MGDRGRGGDGGSLQLGVRGKKTISYFDQLKSVILERKPQKLGLKNGKSQRKGMAEPQSRAAMHIQRWEAQGTGRRPAWAAGHRTAPRSGAGGAANGRGSLWRPPAGTTERKPGAGTTKGAGKQK